MAARRMTEAAVQSPSRPLEPYGRVVVLFDIAGNRWDLLGLAVPALQPLPATAAFPALPRPAAMGNYEQALAAA
jgi:hypothetical protein